MKNEIEIIREIKLTENKIIEGTYEEPIENLRIWRNALMWVIKDE